MLYCSYTVYTVSFEMLLVKGVALVKRESNQLRINARARVITAGTPRRSGKEEGRLVDWACDLPWARTHSQHSDTKGVPTIPETAEPGD